MMLLKRHIRFALAYFLIAGLLGLLLRLFFVSPLPMHYRHVVHGHSHIALLGWAYLALTTLIYAMYFGKTKISKSYRTIFWATNVTLLGMLFTFPFQGYAWLSITFSTLFLIASYFFAGWVFKNIPDVYKNTASFKCAKAALWYMVLSSIGPWALGGIMTTVGSTSIWYKMAIYFYLHFQYNAWFILTLVGVVLYLLEKAGHPPSKERFNIFFFYINGGLILSFFLSVLWIGPPPIFYFLAGTGAILQVVAFWKLFLMLNNGWKHLKRVFSPLVNLLLIMTGILLGVKVVLQLLVAFPYFASLSYSHTDFIIGYLHLVFIGVVGIGLFALLNHFLLLALNRTVFWCYFTGFVLSEALIFYKGICLWLKLPIFADYFTVLVICSGLIPLAVGAILFKSYVGPFGKT
jgi:hypothetical protein